MLKEKVEEKAYGYFQSGFHCAEAISKAIVEFHQEGSNDQVQRFAAGFMGGIGGTHEDVCGALTGGIIAIGSLCGRTEPDQPTENIKELATEFRGRFIEEFGSSNCQVILERLSKRQDGFDCKKLTAVAAGILSELLVEKS
jgi:C_GCAxxG_C_C family probable redox protein